MIRRSGKTVPAAYRAPPGAVSYGAPGTISFASLAELPRIVPKSSTVDLVVSMGGGSVESNNTMRVDSPDMQAWSYSNHHGEAEATLAMSSSDYVIDHNLDDNTSSTQDTVMLSPSPHSELPPVSHAREICSPSDLMLAEPRPPFPISAVASTGPSAASASNDGDCDTRALLYQMLSQKNTNNFVLAVEGAKVDAVQADSKFRFVEEATNLYALSQKLESVVDADFVNPDREGHYLVLLSSPETPLETRQRLLSWQSILYASKLLCFISTGESAHLTKLVQFCHRWHNAVRQAVEMPDIYDGLQIVAFVSCPVMSLLLLPSVAQSLCNLMGYEAVRCNQYLQMLVAKHWPAPNHFTAHLVFDAEPRFADVGSDKFDQVVKDVSHFAHATRNTSSCSERALAISSYIKMISEGLDASDIESIFPSLLDVGQQIMLLSLVFGQPESHHEQSQELLNLSAFFAGQTSDLEIGICPLQLAPFFGTLVKHQDMLTSKIENSSVLTIQPSGIMYM